MPTESKKIKELRRDYNTVKKIYKQIGKKTLGTPKNSPIRRDYKEVKAEYNRIGRQLGHATGKRPRRR